MNLCLTVAIPTYNRPDTVAHLLESIAQQTHLPCEILVIDSSPGNETERIVREVQLSPIAVHYLHHEKGLTRQRNRAIAEAVGDILLFLDDDVVLEPDCLKHLMVAFEKAPDLVGVGAYIVNEFGKPVERFWPIRKSVALLPGEYVSGKALPYGVVLPLSTLQPFSGLYDADWLPGCATAWRTSVFSRQAYSTFFHDYGLAEDKHFSIRAAHLGRLAICGDARIRHLKASGGRGNRFELGYYHVRNHIYILDTCFPEHVWWRRYQQLWYWLIESLLKIVGGTLAGSGLQKIPIGLGMLWGILSHLLPIRYEELT